jgi:hypothetical protein
VKSAPAETPRTPKYELSDVQQNANVQLRWDALTVEQRLAIVDATAAREGRISARLKHKLIYGRWDDLGKQSQDAVYRTNWFSALKLAEATHA